MRMFLFSILLVAMSMLAGSNSIAATLYTYTNGGSTGLWNVAGTWTTDPSGLSLTGSAVPGNGDAVIILNGFTVTLNANVVETGLSITINNGGTLDVSTFTFPTISSLSGGGTLKIKSGNFPTITTNNFASSAASGATVNYYDFAGTLPVSINYPNLTFSNSTGTSNIISFANTGAYAFTIGGNFITQTTGAGTLSVKFGTQATNVIALTINGNVTIGVNTTWGVASFNAFHTITLFGNMTNNGTVQFSNTAAYTASASTNGVVNTTFSGATDNTLACNGLTNLFSLIVDKGIGSTNILSVTSTSTSNLVFFGDGYLVKAVNGTLRLGANITMARVCGTGCPNTPASASNFNVGATATSPMLWIDGATVNTNNYALVIYGKFRITAGTFTAANGEGSVIREDGQYLIDGGTYTTEKFRPSTSSAYNRGSFIMTGGTFNATGNASSNNGYARFSLPYSDQVFIMSGGTLNVTSPEPGGPGINGGIHIGCSAANYNVTGGTVNAILNGTASFYNILSTAPFYDFNITRTGGTPTTVRLATIGAVTTPDTERTPQPLTVLHDFTISGTNTPTFDARGLNVAIGHDLIINSGGTYTSSVTPQTIIFNGAAAQTITNNGTLGLYNLTMNKASGVLSLGGSSTYTVAQTLTLTSGVLNDGGKTIQVAGNIHNEATHTGTGNITLNGASTQTISGDGNGTFGNLILNNPSTPGANATADLAVSGTLTLAGTAINSLFDINQNLLSLNNTSSNALITTGDGFGSAKMVRTLGLQSDNGIKKTFNSLSPFTFAFGVGSNYTPAIIQLTSAPTTYGTISARPVSSRHQFVVASNTHNLTWYWKVNSSGFTGIGPTAVSHTYQYIESSVPSAGDDVTYIPASYNPTSWSLISNLAQVDDTNNLVLFSSIGFIDGEFTAGEPAAFGPIKVFYSKRNGNWSDVTAGTTPWSNVSHAGTDTPTAAPVVGDQVFIGDGSTFNHVITITANAQAAGGLAINAGSTLDVGIYTGHNFGTFQNSPITGSGTLRISSATATAEFPAGDFGNFIRSTGGTVEYYTTGAQDFTIPLISATPTLLPLISYRNLTLTPASVRFIVMPNQDLRIYGNMTVQGASSTGIAKLNSTTAKSLVIDGNLAISGGNLQFQNGTAQSLEVGGNITVGATGIFNLAGSGTAVTNLLSLEGNLTNDGVFDFANGSYITNTTFLGSTSTSITGSGATTDFNILTVNKGTSASTLLNVNATAFTLSSVTTPLVLNTGTFRLTSAQTVTFANALDFSIPSTAGLSANGGTLQLTGANGVDLLLSGTLEVLNGTVNIGTTATDNSIEYAPTGQPVIIASGGTLNVRSQLRRSFASTQGALVYTQSGSSIVTVGTSSASTTNRGVFEILNTGSSFSMTGGTLRVARALGTSIISDLYLQPASYTVSGGTIEIGASGSSQTIDINSIIPVYNVSVTGSTNTARLETTGLTMRGSLNIAAGNIFNANSLAVNIAGDFTNSNALATTGVTVGGYQAGSASQTTTLNGSTGNQTIAGVSGNLSNFGNLVINNTFASGSVTLQTNTNLMVNGALTLLSGTVVGAGNTITALSTVSNSVTQTNTAGGSITLGGSSSQFITGSGSGKFGNVILNNTSGAAFGANQEITGVLTFTNGSLQIGSFSLKLSNTSLAAIAGATTAKYIITSGNLSDGGVTKSFAANVTAGNFIYPIGVSGKYTPANYTITTGVLGGTITIKPVNSKHPSATGSGLSFINYYWSVSNSVIILNALTHTYTYNAADESAGGTLSTYRDARFKGGAWTIDANGIADDPNPNISTRVITFTNTDVSGDYTTGEPTAFVNPTTYTSHASGSWESEGTIWTPTPPGTGIGPPAGSFVIISVGDVITMTSNSKRMATLEVKGRLHLGNTNGHDFGTVTTSGAGDRTVQLQSSTFPSGDFTNFTAAGGGTVEYDGTVILPTQNTYNNLTFTSAGTKTLPNADLTINGNVTVFAGTATNAVNNRSIVMVSPTGDFTNNAVFTVGSGIIFIGRNLINTGAAAVFNAGTGTFGLQVPGSLTNSASATFLMNSDSLGVRGQINNSATFTGSSGPIRVTGNLNNTAGIFTSSTGFVTVSGSLINNATYAGGAGATLVKGSYTNTGASAIHNANANVMTVRGNFTNSALANFNANSGSVLTTGNWINSAAFNAGTSSVTFNSASAQTLTGATTFYNLTRSTGGSLTLNNDITATNVLTLTSGNIITGSNSVNLTNTAAQSVTGYSATSFIDGRLSTSFPNTASTTRIYPVGKGSIYRPVFITQTATSTSPVIRVEMINTPPTGTYPTSVGILSEARYYKIEQASGTMSSPTVGLSFNTNGTADENVFLASNVHILRSAAPSGPWTDEGGTGVFTPAAPAGNAVSGVTSFITSPTSTYFALGYQNAPLPISLASFKGVLSKDVVELSWSTFTEKNNAYFTIERSVDGVKFESVGSVDGAGNSQKTLYYHMTDVSPLPDVSYYRLKQTDYDSRFTYSELVKIVNPRSERPAFVVYPVPSRVSDPLMLKLTNSTEPQAYLAITDIAGRVFYTGYVNLTDELNLSELNLTSRLERGVYLVHVVAGSLNDTRRIVLY
jgi:fibronectin-binding autotransporter adhesin